MGFFDSLFGGGKQAEKPKKKKKKKRPSAEPVAEEQLSEIPPAVTVEGDIDPKVVAAIMASIECMTNTDDAELIAAITAAIIHAQSAGSLAVRIKRTNTAWASAGRQKIMDSRQFA